VVVVVMVVKVECKITSGLPPSCLYSYQRQTGAKPKWWSNLLWSVGNSCKMNLCWQKNMWSYG